MAEQEKQTSSEQTFPKLPQVNLEKVAGYGVFDRNNERIGTTTAIWTDHSGQPAFVGVRTTWLFGKTHMVPAYGAEVNHASERIRLPYIEEDVKNAPSYDPDAELTFDMEREVFSYYRGKGTELPEMEGAANITPMPREEQPATAREETTIPLHEEEVKVGKRVVETGGVRLRKIVHVETVQQPVELQREEVVIERVPAEGGQPSEAAFQAEDIYIPLRREEPVIEKEARVREEVRARKATAAEQQTVSGEVRKEDIEIEKQRKAA